MCLGEYLEPSLPQLPQLTTRVALIYNLKSEAASTSSLPSGHETKTYTEEHPTNISHHGTDDPRSAQTITDGLRVNDVYAEWDSADTVNAVRVALAERYEVLMIEADETAYQKILENRPIFAFNMSEGLHGASREAQIPAILEMLGIPYLGSDPLTLAVCLDKSRAKEILSYYRVPTPRFMVVRNEQQLSAALRELTHSSRAEGEAHLGGLALPAMVKPLHEGSSKGIYNSSLARTADDLIREVNTVRTVYRQPALVEEFLPGREFTVGILGNGEGARTLPIVEIKFDALPAGVNHIYSFEAKWIWDQADSPLEIFECPATLEASLESRIKDVCLKAYRVLNCRDWARIDVRLNGQGEPNILELNPLPGILPRPEDNSCLPKAARAAGMSYSELINAVLDISMERWGIPARAPRQTMANVYAGQ